ncbi:hypothetical protein R1sor_020389 [Riccia sorocarpa]|uniref:Histone deacetylase domain-containing protein n=1 Tax=Riccia sorocarpa TaxID=122646 RepID=A0ABD3II18_9MARC
MADDYENEAVEEEESAAPVVVTEDDDDGQLQNERLLELWNAGAQRRRGVGRSIATERIINTVSIPKKGPIAPYIRWHDGVPAELEQLTSFHPPAYIRDLLDANKAGGKVLCEGTQLNPGSWKAALLAAGTTMTAMQYIVEGHGKLAYALVRPPGHHAQPTQADGYCFLNNAGVAVQLDPNGRQCITAEGYRTLGRILAEEADKHADGRLLLVQEGGYHVTYSAYCAHFMAAFKTT